MSTTRQTPTLRLKATRHIAPPPRVSSAEWLASNITMPKGTETSGMPFSLASYPHVDGVLKAFDDPSVRIIVLQWGTRLGKTTTHLSLMAKVSATYPRNMMLAGPTKDATARVVSGRLYPLLESSPVIAKGMLPKHRRSVLDVRLEACRIYIGWSGSETSLADVGAWYGSGIEIDKWDEQASSEADSLALFLNRFKGFPNHKIVLESTPTIKGSSRVDNWMQRSNRHTRYVPCPHCGEFQSLIKGDGESAGGFRWEKTVDDKNDPDLAFRTAWYECRVCRQKIENYHRIPMLRRGVWVPDGCTVNKAGEIEGTATKAGSDVVGFGPLPSWYSLTETWGSFARAWLRAQKRPRDLQDVINSYMAETWEVKKSKSSPEILAERICGDTPGGIVPEGGLFLTVTVDRQAADGGFCVYGVMAHGAEDRSWLIHIGMARKLSDIWSSVMRATYPHADGGLGLVPVAVGIDSGWNTKDTYDFCNAHPGVLALKGSSTDLGGNPYKIVNLGPENNRQLLMHVNTDYWETDIESRLNEKLRGEPGSLTLAADARTDTELLQQLLNGQLKDAVDSRGNAKLLWQKKTDSVANEFRDIVRYGHCLARAWIDENDGIVPQRRQPESRQTAIMSMGDTRPDGRPFLE